MRSEALRGGQEHLLPLMGCSGKEYICFVSCSELVNEPGKLGSRCLWVCEFMCEGKSIKAEEYICLSQDEGMQRTQENLLSPRKMSVSRMHSLPNDSYMFRPVRPASAPYPLEEVETSQGYLELGIKTQNT